MQDVKRIESYGLYDFCQDVQAAFQEGYVFDFDTNENFPTAYGTMLTCGLVKATAEVTKISDNPELQQAVAEGLADGSLVPEGNTEEVPETVTQTEQTEENVQNTEQTASVTSVVEEVAEVPETAPAKRGPKPKNK